MYTKKRFIQKGVNFFSIAYLFVFSTLFSDANQSHLTTQQLKINLITQCNNGKGLETDLKILKEALEQLDCLVTLIDLEDNRWNRAHINIFIQGLILEKFPMAKQNWFIPNPEWFEADIRFLDKVDLILCRTKEIEKNFRELCKQTYYLEFTSPDCYQENIKKDYRHFLHLAGGSHLKGTKAIHPIWISNPSFPLLTIVNFLHPFYPQQFNLECISTRLPQNELRILQNQCGFHLCPSETEGFGHYIMEAMSTEAVVITTDAPPMNEFIKDKRCLVPYTKARPLHLGTIYEVDSIQLQNKIEYLLTLSPAELETIGKHNRAVYEQKKESFYEKLGELILNVSALTQ